MRRHVEAIVLLLGALLPTAAVRAQDLSWPQEVGKSVRQLGAKLEETRESLPPWVQRFHLAGNADLDFLQGDTDSFASNGRFMVENARLFLDTELARDLRLGTLPIAGDTSFYVEWETVDEHEVQNRVGSLYLRLDRLFGVEPLNLKVGRVLIPYGEEYFRFSEQRPLNPLISFSAPAPYGWDRGILFFGSEPRTRLFYAAGVMIGNDGWKVGFDREVQLVGKLAWDPTSWSHFSVSGLRTGAIGEPGRAGEATLEFGQTEIVPFGEESDVPNFQHGHPVPDDPREELSMNAGEVDAILQAADCRLWLGLGRAAIRSAGASTYDRDLTYAIAEGIVGLGRLSYALEKVYLAARYSVIGTFDSERGYRIEAMNEGEDIGFNARQVTVVSAGVGVRLTSFLTLKTEYSWYEFALVRGVSAAVRDEAGSHNQFGIGATFWF